MEETDRNSQLNYSQFWFIKEQRLDREAIWANSVGVFSGHEVRASEFLLLQIENCLKLKRLSDLKNTPPLPTAKIHGIKTFFIRLKSISQNICTILKLKKPTFYSCVLLFSRGWRGEILELFYCCKKCDLLYFIQKTSLKVMTFFWQC